MHGHITRQILFVGLLFAGLAGAASAQNAAAPGQQAAATTTTVPAPVVQPPPVVVTPPGQTVVTPPTAQTSTPIPQPPLPREPLNGTFVKWMIVALGVVGLIALLIIQASLRGSGKWSLADALSEEGTVTLLDPDGVPVNGADGKPQMVTRLIASTSRLIALMGLFGILLLYCGFGATVLYYFATAQPLPQNTDEVRNFLFAGLTLFAPYIVSKFASVFSAQPPVRQ
jgi:hypothetical protein